MKKVLIIACIIVSAFIIVAFNSSNEDKQQSGDYIVVKVHDLGDFQSQIKMKLQQGWKLAGGVTLYGNLYMQAMYK